MLSKSTSAVLAPDTGVSSSSSMASLKETPEGVVGSSLSSPGNGTPAGGGTAEVSLRSSPSPSSSISTPRSVKLAREICSSSAPPSAMEVSSWGPAGTISELAVRGSSSSSRSRIVVVRSGSPRTPETWAGLATEVTRPVESPGGPPTRDSTVGGLSRGLGSGRGASPAWRRSRLSTSAGMSASPANSLLTNWPRSLRPLRSWRALRKAEISSSSCPTSEWRSSGRKARALTMMSSSSWGSHLDTSLGRGGLPTATLRNSIISLSAQKGRTPVSSSYRMIPAA